MPAILGAGPARFSFVRVAYGSEGVERARDIRVHYAARGPRDPEKTINALLQVLDDLEGVEAVWVSPEAKPE